MKLTSVDMQFTIPWGKIVNRWQGDAIQQAARALGWLRISTDYDGEAVTYSFRNLENNHTREIEVAVEFSPSQVAVVADVVLRMIAPNRARFVATVESDGVVIRGR